MSGPATGGEALEAKDALQAELLDRLAEATDFRHAGASLLGAVVERAGFDRACLLVRAEGEVRAAGWQVGREEVRDLRDAARRLEGPLSSALEAGEPGRLPAFPDGPTEDPRDASAAWTVLPVSCRSEGDVLLALEGEEEGDRADRAVSILRPFAPQMIRRAALESLRDRSARLGRDRDLGRQLLDGIPDPVLLVDADMRVVMANDRADELLFPESADSEGRSRAVQFNAFHLNVMLTEMGLDEAPGRSRELTLVDPRDGSDLQYEVLSSLASGAGDGEAFLALVLRDITDLKELVSELEMENRRARVQEHRARQEFRRLSAILENVAEPVLVTDAESDIALMNREAERLFGAPEASTGGRDRGTRSNVAKLTSFVNELLLHHERRRRERLGLVDPEDGSELPVEVVSTKVFDDRREAAAVVSVLRDLTPLVEKQELAEELRTLNEELEDRVEEATRELEERNRLLEWQSEELERASRMKSQFLASMSHELRTPINAMLGYTSLMRDGIYGTLNGEQERALDKVNAASEHLLELINDILDLTKIEAGKMPVEVGEVRLEEIFDEIAKTVRPMVLDKPVEFRREMEDGIPVLRTDRTKVRQVLLNLLENAIRHTDEGWVALRARRSEGGGEEERVRLEVRDTGEGIAEADLEAIFEDFRQGDGSRGKKGGAGLGLSISKKLISLLGGSIRVDSEVGKGTLFVIELPVELEPGGVEEQVQRVLMTTARREEGEPPVSAGGSGAASGDG